MKLSAYIVAIVLFCAFSYGMWVLGKKINYAFSYQSMVESTVCDMVKHEYIKDGECD